MQGFILEAALGISQEYVSVEQAQLMAQNAGLKVAILAQQHAMENQMAARQQHELYDAWRIIGPQ